MEESADMKICVEARYDAELVLPTNKPYSAGAASLAGGYV